MRSFRILPEVAEDLAQAAAWYDEHGYFGLGSRFVETFYSCIPHLAEYGEIQRVDGSGFREMLLEPFPWFVFYRYHEDTLAIALVIGAMRRPARIRRLLRSRK